MRRLLNTMILAVAGLALASCGDIDAPKGEDEGSLSIALFMQEETRGDSATTSETYETQTNRLDVFIFDSSNNIYRYESLSSPTTTRTKTYSVAPDTYTVYVIANAPSSLSSTFTSVTTLTGLTSKTTSLGDNSTSASAGFVMGGSAQATVTSSNTSTAAVTLSRYASRVRLVSVTRSADCPAAVSLTASYIENVNTSATLGGSYATPVWANLAGRKSSTVVTASTAEYAALTFSAGATLPHYFYGFQNPTATDQEGPTATAGKTRLVAVATYNGTTYYYPVTFESFERNKTYDVTLKISGPGSSDPNIPISKGSLTVNITVSGWDGTGTAQDITL